MFVFFCLFDDSDLVFSTFNGYLPVRFSLMEFILFSFICMQNEIPFACELHKHIKIDLEKYRGEMKAMKEVNHYFHNVNI